jgi:regulatory protein
LLDKLASEGLQSDARFTESFVHHRVNKGQGPIRIEQELHLRGVDPEIIDACLHSGSIDWQTLAAEVRAKKFGADIPGDFQSKAKQARFLYSRGFGSEVISRILK